MSKPYSPTWRLISVIVLRPLLTLLIRNKWSGRENIPKQGGVIFAPNHLSYVDWGTDALFFQANGRYPTLLIKDGAFKVKGIGPFLYKAGQLPVHRGRADAGLVLKEAEKRLAEGAAVIFYPEGTATRDPDLWPMVAKTGVARQQEGETVPAQDRAYGSRQTGRPDRVGRPAHLRAGTAGRHRGHHGRGDGPGRDPAGGGAARARVRSKPGRKAGGDW